MSTDAIAHTSRPGSDSSKRYRWTLNELPPREWVRRTKTVLLQRGLGAGHPHVSFEIRHPCPFSYRDAEQLITFFTKPGESVLDPFAGVASTLKACALNGRVGTGIELNGEYCRWGQERLAAEVSSTQLEQHPQQIIEGDARLVVRDLAADAYAFVLTSPPYWRILAKPPDTKASKSAALRNGTLAYGDDPRDFGCVDRYEDFVDELADFLVSLRRILQPRRYMAIIVSDFRDGPVLYPYHADLVAAVRTRQGSGDRRLVLQGISIVVQDQKRLFAYGYPTTYVPNIHHHYVLIYRNVMVAEST